MSQSDDEEKAIPEAKDGPSASAGKARPVAQAGSGKSRRSTKPMDPEMLAAKEAQKQKMAADAATLKMRREEVRRRAAEKVLQKKLEKQQIEAQRLVPLTAPQLESAASAVAAGPAEAAGKRLRKRPAHLVDDDTEPFPNSDAGSPLPKKKRSSTVELPASITGVVAHPSAGLPVPTEGPPTSPGAGLPLVPNGPSSILGRAAHQSGKGLPDAQDGPSSAVGRAAHQQQSALPPVQTVAATPLRPQRKKKGMVFRLNVIKLHITHMSTVEAPSPAPTPAAGGYSLFRPPAPAPPGASSP